MLFEYQVWELIDFWCQVVEVVVVVVLLFLLFELEELFIFEEEWQVVLDVEFVIVCDEGCCDGFV